MVSTAFYPLLHPASAPRSCSTWSSRPAPAGDASVFVSGIDPGWALDILPALVSGVGAGITEIRVQELFNYALYDQPDVVREVIGFGRPMDELPLMLLDFSLDMVWAPMVRILADLLDVELDGSTIDVERRPLERTIEVPGHGTFRGGHAGRVPLRGAGHRRRPAAARGRARHPHRRRLRARLAAVDVARRRAQGGAHAATRTSRSRCTAPSRASPAPPAAATPPRPTASSTPSPPCARRRPGP